MNKKLSVVIAMLAGIVLFVQGTPAQTQNTQQATPEKKPSAPSQQAAAPERIAIGDLKKKLESGEKLLLIDVREDWELKADGAIAGAIHIPVADLDARMKDIPKDVQLVFYWAGGGRAERAADKFMKAGYKAGPFCGIRDWKKEGLTVVEKVDRPAPGPIQPK